MAAVSLCLVACSGGQAERCLAQQETVGGQCIPECPAEEERINDECVARCASRELRIDGICQGPKAVRVNSVGYVRDLPKRAVVVEEPSDLTYAVRDSTSDQIVYEGLLGDPIDNEDTGEVVYPLDFTEWNSPGNYILSVPGVSDAFTTLASNERVASTGGWHDAGDYGKYGVNSGFTVGMLLLAWQHFEPALTAVSLPEISEHGGPLPDFLAEVRYELDWMLTTQTPDGSVYHKLTTADFGGFVLPEIETARRAFAPVSAEATADFAAALAMASVVYAPFDRTFADHCLQQAQQAEAWLEANPDYPEVDLTGFTTGEYKTESQDDRFWARASLWAATGADDLRASIEQEIDQFESAPNWDWSNVENLGLFTYALSSSEQRDPEIVNRVIERLLGAADGLVEAAAQHGFGRSFNKYYWGSNGILARTVLNLSVAQQLTDDTKYRDAALRQLDHLLGVNTFGRSQVTGLGYLPPQHPHHRPSGADRVKAPWPGLLVGGPNGQKMQANAASDLSVPALAWQDVESAYWSNEVAINWNAPLVYALAWFSSRSSDAD